MNKKGGIMKSIILKSTRNYPSVLAYIRSNNRGDLELEVIKTHLNGSEDVLFRDEWHEGSWPELNKNSILLMMES